MNFDACTGDLYIGDVGQGCFEEIDIEKAGEGHHNYGWPATEGMSCYPPGDGCSADTNCDMMGIRMPFATFNTNNSAVTGGAVYRGTAIPSLRGRYFYGEHTGGRVFSITYDRMTDTASAPADLTVQLDTFGWGISSIQNSADGEIYLTTMDTLYRLTAQ
jgi:glucose/arabinose dehydrogenase